MYFLKAEVKRQVYIPNSRMWNISIENIVYVHFQVGQTI